MMKRDDGKPIPEINQHAVDTMCAIAAMMEDVADCTIIVTDEDRRDGLLRALRVSHDAIRDNVVGADGTMVRR